MIDIAIEEEHRKQMLFQWNINQAQMESENKEQKGKKNVSVNASLRTSVCPSVSGCESPLFTLNPLLKPNNGRKGRCV